MIWYAWAIVAITAFGSLMAIVDVERGKNTGAEAVGIVVANALVIWGVVALAERAC